MTYSGGMRRRLDLAMTLVGEPRIIFLDEPTTGLDPRSRRVMWDIVRELVADGVTIFLTTQYLEEADRLASRIALLDEGRVVAQGTPAELKRLVPGGTSGSSSATGPARSGGVGDRRRRVRDEDALALQVAERRQRPRLAVADRPARHEAIEVEALSVRSADLDDVFLSLTGSAGRHHGPTRRCPRHDRLRLSPTPRRCSGAASGGCAATRR